MRLDRYQLGEPLGVGGMGAVLAATHDDGTPVAVKFLSRVRAHDMRARSEFADEIWALARLDHPGIVAILDYGVVSGTDPETQGLLAPGTPFLVMERADGSLDHVHYPTCWAELVPIVRQVLDALAHAHARGVVHRDIKPSNVLRDPGGWKLADFGIAHALDRHDADGSWSRSVGTPSYMAPEQFRGEWRDFGPWTDLYAVGVLVHELCCGVTPFHGMTGKSLAHAVVAGSPNLGVPRFPVPVGYGEWLEVLLCSDYRHRAQRAADVSLWLTQLGEPVSTETAPPLADRSAQRASMAGTTWTIPTDWSPTARGGGVQIRRLEAARHRDRIAVPDRWQDIEVVRPPARIREGSRLTPAPPFVGREAARDVLWEALVSVDQEAAARAVLVRGPPGCGRSALCRWLGIRAHELGAAWVLPITHRPGLGPTDGIAGMFATFLRCVGLERAELIGRMRVLLELREGSGGLEHLLAELMIPAGPDDDAPIRLDTVDQRNGAALAALQVLTGVLGSDADEAPRRLAVVIVDDAHWGLEALGLAHAAMAGRHGLPAPLLFLIAIDDDALAGEAAARVDALAALEGVETVRLEPLPHHLFAMAARPDDTDLLDGPTLSGVDMVDPLQERIRSAITRTDSETSDDL